MRFLVASLLVLFTASGGRCEERQDQIRKLLGQYCLKCHNSKSNEADVDLSTFGNKTTFWKDRRTWQRAAELLESKTMPPEGNPLPADVERKRLIAWVRSSLDGVDWAAVRAPGRVAMTRMTRDEFQFVVQDLFGVRMDADRFLPVEPEGANGFTNDHTSQAMTAKHLVRYLKAAEIVAEAVIDQAEPTGETIHYEVESGRNASWKKPVTTDADGSRGWSFSSKLGNKYQAVSATFDFKRSGTYRIRMRARSKGRGDHAAAWIAVDSVNDASRETGILVSGKTSSVYETELFITRGRHTLLFGYDFYGPLWLPKTPERPPLKLGQSTFDPPPYDRTGLIPQGVTISELNALNILVAEKERSRAERWVQIINEGYFVAVLDNLMLHKFHYEKGYLPVFLGGLDYAYQTSVVPAFRKLSEITGKTPADLEKVWEARQPKSWEELKRIAGLQRKAWNKQEEDRRKQVGDLYVDWIKMSPVLKGRPIPGKSDEVSPYLIHLLPRAIRRPIEADDIRRFVSIYTDQRKNGADHREALKRLLIAIMVSPEFLYQTDGPVTAPGVSKLAPHPFAARMSSFLWASIPDQELFDAASSATLTNEEIDQQVDRMLYDPRSLRLARTFSEQWLNLTDLGLTKEPDKELFRYFSWRLAEDMREEVTRVFDRILRENRSILELLDSDETFLNERLARLYGMDGVAGEEFRLVRLTDPSRGGLLGTAAVLTSTSLATRTSPVRRGQFVLETLLGIELPDPPANVPQLAIDAGQSKQFSLRKSLALHRKHSSCSGCHNRIDPPGFALENFDWIGRWRESDSAGRIDSTTTLFDNRNPDGQRVVGASDLKKILFRDRREQFTSALTRAMLKYALARDLEYYDEDAVNKIVAKVQTDGFRARTLVKEIIRSYPFRFREVRTTVGRTRPTGPDSK